jgi:hypothetical protein
MGTRYPWWVWVWRNFVPMMGSGYEYGQFFPSGYGYGFMCPLGTHCHPYLGRTEGVHITFICDILGHTIDYNTLLRAKIVNCFLRNQSFVIFYQIYTRKILR